MKDRYSNGARYIDAHPFVMRHACSYMHMHGAGRGEFHESNEYDAGYCIDAPALLPAGAMFRAAPAAVYDCLAIREG